MSNLNSWEDDPAAQDENLARQAQQRLNLNQPNQGHQFSVNAAAAAFQPQAQAFQPGQFNYGQQQYQQQYYQQGYYPQYGGAQNTSYDPSQGYQQAGYGQNFGTSSYRLSPASAHHLKHQVTRFDRRPIRAIRPEPTTVPAAAAAATATPAISSTA
jgi:peptide chain release factor subunit 3